MMVIDNALRLLHGLVASVDQDIAERVQIEPARAIGARADIVVNVSGAKQPKAELTRISEAMAKHPAVDDARVRGNCVEVWMTVSFIDMLVQDLQSDSASLQPPPFLAGEHWTINLFDPNATKAMHIGHLRNLSYGMAVGHLCEAHGATVSYQSVVNDMGRSVAEAVAGYLAGYGGESPSACVVKSDHFVGRCYAHYVGRMPSSEVEVSAADAPVRRELQEYRDAADEVIAKWFAHDPGVRKAWSDLMAWTASGHRDTIEHCGLPVPESFMQSDYFDAASRLIRDGLASGLLQRSEQGAVYFPTGRQEYERFPLARADGMSTEHLRTVAVWQAILSREESEVRYIHVLGDEWRISTECRLQLFEILGHAAGVRRYAGLYHGMVLGRQGKLASSAGDAVLIDDELARLSMMPEIESRAKRLTLAPRVLARIIISGLLLGVLPVKSIQFSAGDVFDARRNPVLVILDALDRAVMDAEGGATVYQHESLELRRYALRTQVLPRLIGLGWERRNPEHVLRYLMHLSEMYLQTARCAVLGRIMRGTLHRGLTAIGMWQA